MKKDWKSAVEGQGSGVFGSVAALEETGSWVVGCGTS